MTLTNEQQIAAAQVAYAQAQEAEVLAKKNLEDLKASGEAVTKAFEAAKKVYDGFKPSLNVAKAQVQAANAQVTITRATLVALDPKAIPSTSGKGTGNKELLGHVVSLLTGKPDGLENGAIFDGLLAAGVALAGEKARENLNSYLSRWGAVEAGGVVSAGTGKWKLKVAGESAPPAGLPAAAPAGLPAGLPVTEAPAGLPAGLPTSTPLGEDFPGFIPLGEAGITTREQLAGKSEDDLKAIKGIGAGTATKILAALA